jgi:hypothetical protein
LRKIFSKRKTVTQSRSARFQHIAAAVFSQCNKAFHFSRGRRRVGFLGFNQPKHPMMTNNRTRIF